MLIRYTKKADKLPVTTFGIDIDKPCMDSGAQVNPFYHTLELNKYDACPIERVNNLQTDPRFNFDEINGSDNSFEIDFWDFVNKNGVA